MKQLEDLRPSDHCLGIAIQRSGVAFILKVRPTALFLLLQAESPRHGRVARGGLAWVARHVAGEDSDGGEWHTWQGLPKLWWFAKGWVLVVLGGLVVPRNSC